jgi:hypothetical protein
MVRCAAPASTATALTCSPHALSTRTHPQTHHACVAFTPQEALRAEIERKRKLKDAEFGGRKFMKVSELDAAREATKRGAGGGAAAPAAEGGAEVRVRAHVCVVCSCARLGLGTRASAVCAAC